MKYLLFFVNTLSLYGINKILTTSAYLLRIYMLLTK